MNDTPSYTQAFEELEVIVRELEQADINIDELSDKIKRASLLLNICKSKLHGTENEVNSLIEKIN